MFARGRTGFISFQVRVGAWKTEVVPMRCMHFAAVTKRIQIPSTSFGLLLEKMTVKGESVKFSNFRPVDILNPMAGIICDVQRVDVAAGDLIEIHLKNDTANEIEFAAALFLDVALA